MEGLPPVLPPEKIIEANNLRERNRNDKSIIRDLDYILGQMDAQDATAIAKRRVDFSEKMDSQIFELRKIGFEKAVTVNTRYKFAEDILAHLSFKPNFLGKLHESNQEREQKAEKHGDEYAFDVDAFQQKFIQENNGILSERDTAIENQKRIVETLQRLLENDDEFGEEYIKLLDQASEELSNQESARDSIILDKAMDVLTGLPFSDNLIAEIEKFRKEMELATAEKNSLQAEVIDWEIAPADDKPYLSGGPNRVMDGQSGEMMNYERLEYIESLKPNKIYTSTESTASREYRAYEFDNCVAIASPFALHAIYVMGINNWKDIAKKGKKDLRFSGAVQLKNVAGWEDRLRKFVDREIVLDNVAEEGAELDREEQLILLVRKKIFTAHPEIETFIKEGDFEEAKKLLKKIKRTDLVEMHLPDVYSNFGLFRDMMMTCFPDIDLSPEDFKHSKKRKFKWISREETISNVRETIFEQFPEIKEALESNDEENVKLYLSILSDDDFIDMGLRAVVKGKAILSTVRMALVESFPEITNLSEFLGKSNPKKRYGNKDEKKKAWGERIRTEILKDIPELKELINDEKNEQAKMLIIATIKKEGAANFIKRIAYGFYGASLGGSIKIFIELAFPELNWSDVNLGKKNMQIKDEREKI